jgi:hypothetical protein
VLHQQLSNAWRLRERAFPISPVLTLKPEGLVLGAGTLVLPAEESRRLKSVDGDELRVLALLSAAYGRAMAPAVLRNIERAAKAWREGDDCLAYIHLAHALFPYSTFHITWIAYLSAPLAKGLELPAEILTERTPDGGVPDDRRRGAARAR